MKKYLLSLLLFFVFSFVNAQFLVKETVECKCVDNDSLIIIDSLWHLNQITTQTLQGNFIVDSVQKYWADTLYYKEKKINYKNTQGNDSLILDVYYYVTTSIWRNRSKKEYTYFANGDYSINSFYWVNNQWQNHWRELYLYYNTNLLVEKECNLWDTINNLWEPYYKDTYFYNINNDVVEKISSCWDTSLYVYTDSYKTKYTYNVLLQNDSIKNFRYDSLIWKKTRSYSMTYDLNGDLQREQIHEVLNNQWHNGSYFDYTYNGNHQLDTVKFYRGDLNYGYVYHTRTYYDYGALSVEETEMDIKVKIYPNPATENVLIESDKRITSLDIYDMHGRLIQTKEDFNTELIDLSEYNAGIYVFRFLIDDTFIYQKLIVQ